MNLEKLKPYQWKIYEALIDIDPSLGNIYLGAILVIRENSNPDRIAQAAHSLRELTNNIARSVNSTFIIDNVKSNPSSSDKSETLSQNLAKVIDPYGGVPHRIDAYRFWNNEYHQYFLAVSHHGKIVSFDDFYINLRRFENFLSDIIFKPQIKTLDNIDKIIQQGSDNIDVNHLNLEITKTWQGYIYFWENVASSWFDFLKRQKFFSKIPKVERDGTEIRIPIWPESKYLARIAKGRPKDVLEVILNSRLSKTNNPEDYNPRILGDFIVAAKNMPPEHGVKIIKKIHRERWIEAHDFLLSEKLNNFLESIIQASQWRKTGELASILLQVKLKKETARRGYRDVEGYLKDYQYKKVLETISAIPLCNLRPFIKLLINKLCTAIALEQGIRIKEGLTTKDIYDASSSWRPAIEDSEQNWNFDDIKELLVVHIRNSLEKYLQHIKKQGVSDLNKELDDILQYDPYYPILERIKIHICRIFYDDFSAEIEKIVVKDFYRVAMWHEYALLIKELFGNFSKEIQKEYFGLIESGPKDEKDGKYTVSWKISRLSLVKDHLNKDLLREFKALLKGRSEPDHPDFLSTGTMWTGPTSPKTEKELFPKTVNEIIDELISWMPSTEHFSPSPEGLGRVLEQVIEKRAKEFSENAAYFLNSDIRPTYIYHLFNGLRKGLKQNSALEWEQAINFANNIIQKAKQSELPIFEKDSNDPEIDWNCVFQAISDLIKDGLNNKNYGIAFKYRDKVFGIIEYLCSHPEPTVECEGRYGGDNMGPYKLSINTVRGQAFHALFAYMFWCNRNIKKTKRDKDTIVEEVKNILEKHLDTNIEPCLTIRSVYGWYFSWLYLYDKKWTESILDKLFPENDRERRFAAWETYLANKIYREVFTAMREEYKKAIAELTKPVPKRKYWCDTVERLAEHIMIGFLYDLDTEEDSLFTNFFTVADAKQRAMAISFAGRAYINIDDVHGHWFSLVQILKIL